MSIENEVNLTGNLGRDPEIFKMGNIPPFAKIQLATNKRWKKAGEKYERTYWHTVYLSTKLANLAELYLAKGDEVTIKGELINRKWRDKEGRNHTENVIQALSMRFGRRKSKSVSDLPVEDTEEAIADEVIDDADITF